MNNIFYVYVWYRKSDNTPFYVGKGMEKRFTCLHNRNRYFLNTLKKHGGYSKKIKENLTEEEALNLEKELIKEYRKVFKLTNMVDGGLKGTTGLKHSEKTKFILSKKSKAQWKDPIKRARLIEARKRGHNTPEAKLNFSRATKGRILTDEHKENIKESLKNKTVKLKMAEAKTKYRNVTAFNPQDDVALVTFPTTREAVGWLEQKLGTKISMSSVIGAISGKNKTSYGYRWSAEKQES